MDHYRAEWRAKTAVSSLTREMASPDMLATAEAFLRGRSNDAAAEAFLQSIKALQFAYEQFGDGGEGPSKIDRSRQRDAARREKRKAAAAGSPAAAGTSPAPSGALPAAAGASPAPSDAAPAAAGASPAPSDAAPAAAGAASPASADAAASSDGAATDGHQQQKRKQGKPQQQQAQAQAQAQPQQEQAAQQAEPQKAQPHYEDADLSNIRDLDALIDALLGANKVRRCGRRRGGAVQLRRCSVAAHPL